MLRSLRAGLTARGALMGVGAICLGLLGTAGCATPRASAPMRPVRSVSSITWDVLGTSRDGRPVRAATIIGSRADAKGGLRAAVIAGIHGDEREGGRHLPELLALLLESTSTVRVYEDVNPDGTWRNARTTTRGVDPNRNWPATNFQASRQCGPAPLSEPGVAAVHGDLVSFAPDLVIVLHSNSRRRSFVNFDGPAQRQAATFAHAAGDAWTVEPSMGYPTPGSLGTWMGVDRQIPILTIEFNRGMPEAESRPALLAGVASLLGGPWDERTPTSAIHPDPETASPPDEEFRVN